MAASDTEQADKGLSTSGPSSVHTSAENGSSSGTDSGSAGTTSSGSSGRPPRKPLSLPKQLLFASIAVIGFFVGIEGLLTALNIPPPIKAYNTRPDIFWGLEANLQDQPFLHKEMGTSFAVTTNSHSLRYTEVPVGRQPQTIRLLALGDSTTFGWGVEQPATWTAVAEKILQEKHPEVKIQVLNGGVPGYTSFQGLHHYKKNASLYDPDLVMFDYIVQDARKTVITDKQQAIAALNSEFLEDNPILKLRMVRLLRNRYALFRTESLDQANQQASEDPNATTRVPLEDYKENILTFQKLTQQKGSTLLLFGFPLEVVGYTKAHRDLMAQLAESQKILHFDPSSTIAEEARRATLYFPKDKGHPNAAGCEKIGTLLAEYLESSGVLARLIEARK